MKSLSSRHHDNLWGLERQLQSTSQTRARTEAWGHYDCHKCGWWKGMAWLFTAFSSVGSEQGMGVMVGLRLVVLRFGATKGSQHHSFIDSMLCLSPARPVHMCLKLWQSQSRADLSGSGLGVGVRRRKQHTLGDVSGLNKCFSVETTPPLPAWWRQLAAKLTWSSRIPILGHPGFADGEVFVVWGLRPATLSLLVLCPYLTPAGACQTHGGPMTSVFSPEWLRSLAHLLPPFLPGSLSILSVPWPWASSLPAQHSYSHYSVVGLFRESAVSLYQASSRRAGRSRVVLRSLYSWRGLGKLQTWLKSHLSYWELSLWRLHLRG